MSGPLAALWSGSRPSSAAYRFLPALVLLAAALLLVPQARAAEDPYEPNDSVLNAAGPLLLGTTYAAALQREGDKDLFAFYIARPAEAELSLTNLAKSGAPSDISATILDSAATPIAGEAFIRGGETRTLAAHLEPQRYYVEVTTGTGFGDPYSLLPAGGAGAFAPYAQIAARCAAAGSALTTAEARLERAEARRQRALARLRRSRYAAPAARRAARLSYRRAGSRLRSARRAVRAAAAAREPWCSIAP